MMGQIEAVNRSKTGKTLGVKIGDKWYTTKSWELENSVGKTIIFEPSTSEFNGQTMYWINEYQHDDTGHGPAARAFDEAHAQKGNGRAKSDKDIDITALALCKCCTLTGAEGVWENFEWFKNKLREDEIPY